MTARRITMSELARLAGVDISTVSRALKASPLVREETRNHILKLAEETGYEINASAASLRRQSSGALGIVIPTGPHSDQTVSDAFFLEIIGAVSEAASERGYDLVISAPRVADGSAERHLLRSRRVDGVILIGQTNRTAEIAALAASTPNMVVWGERLPGADYLVVGSDNRLGGRLAGDHLLDAGARAILYLGDPAQPEVANRFAGFLDAHQRRGLDWDRDLLVRVGFGGRQAFEAVAALLDARPGIDAVCAASDVLATTALSAVLASGRRAPRDVRVVGYDDIRQARMVTPSLTTVSQDIGGGGRLLVDTLLRRIRGEEACSAYTDTRLVLRESSPAPG